ncbi:hypothetical protein KAOT1_03857 [Kordia algicida OT-1]|uniref:DUF7192 domain-containing protein n=2 Tax=Kordia TaxID=221065 RepID=A9DW60_9FLAO|nr:hypothetical protein KAOT1_03857 [Kordia algicida OT-1]
MKIPKKHTLIHNEQKYNYLQFDSVFTFNEFVDHKASYLSDHNQSIWKDVMDNASNRILEKKDWFGSPIPKSLAELESHTSFLGMHLLKEIQPKIQDKLSAYLEYLAQSELPKPKIAYNDRGLGVFSFDRAAMGMFKIHTINRSTPIEENISKLNIELGRKQIQTSVKSVYAYFKDKQNSYPSLELYIMAGANSTVKGNNLLFVGLSCALLVTFMEERGISVEVNVLIGSHFRGQTTLGQIRVKRFQDKLDTNQLLLISSDPRYFRYRGFKALITMADHFGYKMPEGLGRLTSSLGNNFVSAINQRGFVFEQSYAMDKAVREVATIITTYKKRLDEKK